MKKILFLVGLIFFFSCAQSQIYQHIKTWYEFDHLMGDSSFRFPTGCGAPTGLGWLRNNKERRAAIYFDSCAKKPYIFNPSDSTWAPSTSQVNDSTWLIFGDTLIIHSTGGGGAGTVNSGTQYRLAYYAANGTAVSENGAITGNRALASNTNGLPIASSVTDTELGHLSGVTSALQSQLNGKQATLNLDLGRLPKIYQRYPAQGITATGTTVTNYPISALDSNNYKFTTTNVFGTNTKFGGVLWATPVGDSMRISAPFGVLAGSSFVEGHPALHGRLHWLLNSVPQSTFNPSYPDSVGQMSYHLRELTGYRWYNHGIGGQTSSQMRLRWVRDVLGDSIPNTLDGRGSRTLSRKPMIVVYDGVGNDPYFSITPAQSIANLEWMAKSCQDNNIRFIVCNSPTGISGVTVAAYRHLETVNKFLESGGLDKYNAVVFDLKTYWSDPAWGYDGVHMRPDLRLDGIHFTKAGYDSLSRTIFNTCKIPVITKLGIINELAPSNPVTNFAYADTFTVQGVGYQMSAQSQELTLRAALTSDSVWVKAIDVTTVAGAGTQYGYGHIYWQLDNNVSNDSLYTRRTPLSNSASTNYLDASTLVITPEKHLNNETVLDIKNAANDASSLIFRTGSYPKMLLHSTSELGTGAVLSVGNAGQATSIHSQGNLKVDGTTSYVGWLEILRGTGLPTSLGRGIAINGTNNEFALYGTSAQNKDQFSIGYYFDGTVNLGTNPTALLSLKSIGFGDAMAPNQIGNTLSIRPRYNQTVGAQTGIQMRGIYYNPILTSLTNTRHFGIFAVTGNNYFNIASDSSCFGCDSTENVLAKFRVKGSVRLDIGSDATGDMHYRNSSGLLSRITPGNNGDVLRWSSGVPAWQAPSTSAGAYAPTTTLVTNVDGATVQSGQYTRIDNVITGSLSIDIDPTVAGAVEVALSLPAASTFSSSHICSGTANADGIAGQVTSDATNSRIRIVFTAPDGTSRNFRINFQYTETAP